MIYLNDNGYRINSALKTLVNQVKYPDGYKNYLFLCCKVEVNFNDNVDQGTCFADDNAKDNAKDNSKDNANDNVQDNGNVKGDVNVKRFHPQPTADFNDINRYQLLSPTAYD